MSSKGFDHAGEARRGYRHALARAQRINETLDAELEGRLALALFEQLGQAERDALEWLKHLAKLEGRIPAGEVPS
jgi:hypothetical protein